MIKNITIFALSIGALWDGFTTLFGTEKILGGSGEQIIASIIFTIIIFGFMISTALILRTHGALGNFLKTFWLIALIYDLYTSYIGNVNFIIGNDLHMNNEQTILIIVFTILATSSPMIVGLIFNNSNSNVG